MPTHKQTHTHTLANNRSTWIVPITLSPLSLALPSLKVPTLNNSILIGPEVMLLLPPPSPLGGRTSFLAVPDSNEAQ